MKDESKKFFHWRWEMVEKQIVSRGITDPLVLEAMRTVPRHLFVSEALVDSAYGDFPLPIGEGQTISQPYIIAEMTQNLELKGHERVLEIGTGSGYQAAVLAEIVKTVYTVEIVQPLHARSEKTLSRLGYKNISTLNKDGYFGWVAHAPYDAIVVTCAADFVPPPLIKQLKPGGRMCIPVGPPFKVQHLVLITKTETGEILTKVIASVRFVPLTRKGE
ncbi:MAG: protein-L-isoaspartate(D-aspartate) O-methyltransferase [Desulfobacula sp.]|nr:protein-L-isoaspartate(D-aspartate) O-methyltransferase [Desulfobacula sp.]